MTGTGAEAVQAQPVSSEDYSRLGSALARGAVWMIVMRWSIRLTAMVNTLILARVLLPQDFGLVAMAMMVVGLMEVLGMFGFQQIIIQKQTSDRDYYDTAWTLNIIKGLVIGTGILILAYPAATFFHDARVTPVVQVLAIGTFVSGFENIGIVNFSKNLNFRGDFIFLTGKKLISVVVTVVAALILRNYWALAIGIVGGVIAGVILSYVIQPFRPRLGVRKASEIFAFSKWLVTNEFMTYVTYQVDNMIVGRYLNPQTLGVYSVSKDIVQLPSGELVMPLTRALFPGYARIAHDRPTVKRVFVNSLSLVLMVAWPLTYGLLWVANDVVPVLLGTNWLAAIPLIKVLAINGCIAIAWVNVSAVLLALGQPAAVTRSTIVNQVPRIVLVLAVAPIYGLDGILGVLIVCSVINYFFNYYQIRHHLGVGVREIIGVQWRIISGLAVMSLVIFQRQYAVPLNHLPSLIVDVALGGLVYAATVILLWWLSGCPEGPESLCMGAIRKKLSANV